MLTAEAVSANERISSTERTQRMLKSASSVKDNKRMSGPDVGIEVKESERSTVDLADSVRFIAPLTFALIRWKSCEEKKVSEFEQRR